MTLRFRIALILATVALLVGVFAAGASYVTTASQLQRAIDDSLRSRALDVNHGRDAPPDRGRNRGPNDGAAFDCPDAGAFQPASAAQIVAADGTVTVCIAGGPALTASPADRAIAADDVRLRTSTIGGSRYRILTTAWHDGGVLQIARSLAESESLLGRLRLKLLALVGVATAVAAALGWAVATRIAKPIVSLRDAAHQIATTQDLTAPVDVGGSGEIASLATSFSMMIASLAHSQAQQRRLVSDASHEMRTPLTSLRSNLELIGQIERLPVAERQDVVAEVIDDVDELSILLAELVELASDLSAAEPVDTVSLLDLAQGAAERAERRTHRQVEVTGEPTEVVGRPRQLERAIANLVDNALKYSPADAPVEVDVSGTTVTVRDRGRGIPAADLDHIFDRFYRAIDARTEPGSGLGLAIVDEIVRTHRGSVFARNRDGGGAEVGFTLPTS